MIRKKTHKIYEKIGRYGRKMVGNNQNIKLKSRSFTKLICNVCGSIDIVETQEGYVISLLEISKLTRIFYL